PPRTPLVSPEDAVDSDPVAPLVLVEPEKPVEPPLDKSLLSAAPPAVRLVLLSTAGAPATGSTAGAAPVPPDADPGFEEPVSVPSPTSTGAAASAATTPDRACPKRSVRMPSLAPGTGL